MSKWISCKDRLPVECKWHLLTDGERHWLGMKNYSKNNFFCKCCLDNIEKVTHWMELPELPERGE